MKRISYVFAAIAVVAVAGAAIAQQQQQQAPQQPMSFFITSVGLGDGGNLGGLDGADRHCQSLAAAVGRGNATWRAYLSQAGAGGRPQVHARNRIGTGPWYNANGAVIAWDVNDLHEDRNNIRKPTALNEKGQPVNGVGDTPNQHDMLTGSDSQGRLVPGNAQLTTCNNWTSNSAEHRAIVGHHDRLGGASASWNSVHSSGGCTQPSLVQTGGNGYFYCFATN